MTPAPEPSQGPDLTRRLARWLKAVAMLLVIVAALGFIVSHEVPSVFWTGIFAKGTRGGVPPTSTASPTPVPLDVLRARALHLPILAPGEPCPIVPGRTVNPNIGPALGPGPIYLVSLGTDQGVIEVVSAKNFAFPEWDEEKTIFAVRPEYYGIVLLRGHQLDGPNEVRFGNGDVPVPDELSFWADPSLNMNEGWTYVVTYTRVREPGCYAVQADGSTFSEVIVFAARLEA